VAAVSDPKWVDLWGMDPTYGDPIEGVVVDDSKRFDRLCAGMVESMTEFDWEGGPHGLPEHLRQGLRDWYRQLVEWDESRQH
jgi:hypothetical protein